MAMNSTQGLSGGGKAKYTMNIAQFHGVDYANSFLEMSEQRSPDMLNMICGSNGSIKCRNGYETLTAFEGEINGVYTLNLLTEDKRIVHHGSKISLWEEDDTITELYSGIPDKKSSCQQMLNKLYIFTGDVALIYGEFDVLDELGNKVDTVFEVRRLEDEAYIPTTVQHNLALRAETDAGSIVPFEDVNLLTTRRKETFLVDTADTYTILRTTATPIDEIFSIKRLTTEGDWLEVETTAYSYNSLTGIITFTDELDVTPISGADNYEVDYSVTFNGEVDRGLIKAYFNPNEDAGNYVVQPAVDFVNNEATMSASDKEWALEFLQSKKVYKERFYIGGLASPENVLVRINWHSQPTYGSGGNYSPFYTFRHYKSNGTSVTEKLYYTDVVAGTTLTEHKIFMPTQGVYANEGWSYSNYESLRYPVDASGGVVYKKFSTQIVEIDGNYYLDVTSPYSIAFSYNAVSNEWDARSSTGMNTAVGTVEIRYDQNVDNSKDKINKATISTKFGYAGNLDRIFVAGWNNLQEYEFWSDFENPTYFPDLNYAYCGDKDTAIMGWSRIDNNQIAVHKSSNGQDPTIYVQSATMDDYGNVNFPLTEGATGVGVVSQRAFAVLNGEPLALSAEGVFATKLVTDIPTDTKFASPRSFYINPKLKEMNMVDAEAIVFNNQYFLSVDDKVFVADGNQKYMIGGNEGYNYSYDWYVWENVPARVWWIYNNELHFGTADGRICRFNNSYFDDNEPIKCHWCSKPINFNQPAYYKKVKNVYVTVAPAEWAEVNIDYITDKVEKNVKWASIHSDDNMPVTIPTNYKIKKIQELQVKIWGRNAEPLEILNVALLYSVSGKYKG